MLETDHPLGIPTDAARRASDIVTTHLLADREGNVGRWVAIRLSDGGSDGVVYDSVRHAANAQLHYQQCMYIMIRPSGLPPREADAVLKYHRKVYDAGNRPPYLDGFVPIIPTRMEVAGDRANPRHRIGRPSRSGQ
jgi:hypothetical protein